MNVYESRKISIERLTLWKEDDSGTSDRIRREEAWAHLFEEAFPDLNRRSKYIDDGDSSEHWFRWFDTSEGTVYRITGCSFEGGFIEVLIVWMSPVDHHCREFDFETMKKRERDDRRK